MKVRNCKTAVLLLLSVACIASVHSEIAETAKIHQSSRQVAPSIVFSSLLASVSLDARSGKIKLGDLQTAYLPEDGKGKIVLTGPSGKELLNWTWHIDSFRLPPPYRLLAPEGPFTENGDKAAYSDTILNEEGKYALDFYLEGSRFFTYSFGIRRSDPERRSVDEVLYLTDGAWNEWGYLYYANARISQPLLWKIFLRDEQHRIAYHTIDVRIVREPGGTVVCRSPAEKRYHLSHDWVRHDFYFFRTPEDAAAMNYFRAADLLRSEGNYALEMTIDGVAYGRWTFEVRNRKIVRKGKADREAANPLSFIEGGADAWWYKKAD